MPSLEQQARQAIKDIQDYMQQTGWGGSSARHYPLPMERYIVIIWGMYRGWTDKAICHAVGMRSRGPISKIRHTLSKNPHQLFDIPVLHQGLKGNKPLYRCEFCGAQMLVEELEARRHVASHLFSSDIIKFYGVFNKVS